MSSRENAKGERKLEDRIERLEKALGTRQGDSVVRNANFLVEQLRDAMTEIEKLVGKIQLLGAFIHENNHQKECEDWLAARSKAKVKPSIGTVMADALPESNPIESNEEIQKIQQEGRDMGLAEGQMRGKSVGAIKEMINVKTAKDETLRELRGICRNLLAGDRVIKRFSDGMKEILPTPENTMALIELRKGVESGQINITTARIWQNYGSSNDEIKLPPDPNVEPKPTPETELPPPIPGA